AQDGTGTRADRKWLGVDVVESGVPQSLDGLILRPVAYVWHLDPFGLRTLAIGWFAGPAGWAGQRGGRFRGRLAVRRFALRALGTRRGRRRRVQRLNDVRPERELDDRLAFEGALHEGGPGPRRDTTAGERFVIGAAADNASQRRLLPAVTVVVHDRRGQLRRESREPRGLVLVRTGLDCCWALEVAGGRPRPLVAFDNLGQRVRGVGHDVRVEDTLRLGVDLMPHAAPRIGHALDGVPVGVLPARGDRRVALGHLHRRDVEDTEQRPVLGDVQRWAVFWNAGADD